MWFGHVLQIDYVRAVGAPLIFHGKTDRIGGLSVVARANGCRVTKMRDKVPGWVNEEISKQMISYIDHRDHCRLG